MYRPLSSYERWPTTLNCVVVSSTPMLADHNLAHHNVTSHNGAYHGTQGDASPGKRRIIGSEAIAEQILKEANWDDGSEDGCVCYDDECIAGWVSLGCKISFLAILYLLVYLLVKLIPPS